MQTNIRYYPHIDINNLSTLNATFTALPHTQMTLYSTGDDLDCHKTGRFTKVVQPPSPRQKI